MGFVLTREQQAAVDNRGGTLLVSAAAGSGKTRVLVERLLSRVEAGADIDRFLVITYTRAAAAELRERIADALSQRLALRPGDGHLRRQATLVYKAQISTVHALCAQLLRECGHLLDLDPDFRLCDEGEGAILMHQALSQVLEERYENLEPGSDFARLVDTMSAGRDDSRLVDIVLDVRGRVQSHPHPDRWLEQQLAAFALEGVSDVGDCLWGQLLLADARSQARYWQGRMAQALEWCGCEENLSANYAPTLSATLAGLEAFLAASERGWDAARSCLPIPFPTAGRKKIRDCLAEAEQVKALRNTCKKRMEKLGDLFADSSADLLADMGAVYPAVRGLFALVADFEAAYAAEKARRGLVDFSDLEHKAVELLVDEKGPTPLARQWAGRYDEVMVDEYQDTNEVQNAICAALSQGGKNLFLVGDVKQSIYRFRLADPTIFLDKYRTFPPYERAAEGEPRRILLSRNFRSRPQVLEGANYIFRNIMSPDFGEMAYTDDEALVPGASYPEGEGYAVELCALDLAADDEEEEQEAKPTRDLLEARFAARRIAQLLAEPFPVSDGAGGTRPVRPEDIVILLRSPGTVLHHYARALGELGLAWQAEGAGDFFQAPEIHVALALLELVDNPHQDVPLVAALRSPVYGFTPDQLSRLRAEHREGDLYTALVQSAREGDGPCEAFLQTLEGLRLEAGEYSCHQFLWKLYDQTNLMGLYGAMDGGEERQANLLTLAELARRFETGGHRGLFPFLTYLARLRESGNRIAVSAPGQTGGGVRIMSIHKSKGLEFPVVLLCGLARRLNRADLQQPILFHPRLGVGPKFLDLDRGVEYPTLARLAVARQLEREMMAEELRLLYVAMTRAREKLILSCALTGGAGALEKLAGEAALPVDPQVLLGCQTVGQWVLLPALLRPEAEDLRAAAGIATPPPVADYGPAWDIRWVDGAGLEQAPDAAQGQAAREGEDGEDPALAARLAWTYPYDTDVALPSKLTATQLKGRELDQEVAEQAPPPPAQASLRRPRFAQQELGLTPAQRGTALHLVMQYMDFQKGETEQGVAEEIQRLVDRAFLTPEQGAAVDPSRICAFFRSPLGRELMASVSLRREFKFSLLVEADRYFPEAGEGEQVLLQGVVDCLFETLEGITVVDFKTDRVTAQSAPRRGEEYRGQLTAYADALQAILGRPVVRRVLWFFQADTAVEL